MKKYLKLTKNLLKPSNIGKTTTTNQCRRVPNLWRPGSVKMKIYCTKNGRLIPTAKRGKEIKQPWNLNKYNILGRLVSIDAINKISYIFLTYHSFFFYISKLLDVTVILYFLYSFSFSPRKRFVFQTEISGKYIVLVLISRLFYFLSSLRRGDQSIV